MLRIAVALVFLFVLGACGQSRGLEGGQIDPPSYEFPSTVADDNDDDDATSVAQATSGIGSAVQQAASTLPSTDMQRFLDALQQVAGKLNPISSAMNALQAKATPATIKAAEDALNAFLNGGLSPLITFFESLNDTAYAPLIRKLKRMDQMRPVYSARWRNHPTKKSRHFYTNSFSEYYTPISQGVAVPSTPKNPIGLWVYTKPWESCSAIVYRCYNAKTEGDWMSRSANCGGTAYTRKDALGRANKTDAYGYLCAGRQSGEANLPAERLYYPSGAKQNAAMVGDYVVSRSASYATKTLKPQGWVSHGALGYSPTPPTY